MSRNLHCVADITRCHTHLYAALYLSLCDILDTAYVLRHLATMRVSVGRQVIARGYMTLFNDIALAARIAARDMRGGARGL